jgi:CarD family transcriptional regulator
MWSRRAKEYETKINSGNLVSIAEVVRDLHKNVDDPDRSYSERVIYENALNRLAGEFAAVKEIDHDIAAVDLVKALDKDRVLVAA